LEILWPLILGFALSGVVQAVVTKGQMSRLLPDSSLRSIVIATGAASSSCSYAAVALARSIFRKGADFIAAMAFQFASTNLVLELGIILAVLIGWQFVAAEFASIANVHDCPCARLGALHGLRSEDAQNPSWCLPR
jgi:uncharacterized membrane protein YraQ (UPF0718 family)